MFDRSGIPNSQIYAHRGVWRNKSDQNTLHSYHESTKFGFSIETDLRYQDEQIVISHDPLLTPNVVKLSELFEFSCSFAMNIKTDGLQDILHQEMNWINQTNSFVFDGSVPEMWKYQKAQIPHALRLSEYEQELPWDSTVIWLDSFHGDWWIQNSRIEDLIKARVTVVVSPEIHGRDPRRAWDRIGEFIASGRHQISICTDTPFELMDWLK